MTLNAIIEAIGKGQNIGTVDMVDLYAPIIKKLVNLGQQTEASLMERSAFGGECHRCGKPYIEVVDERNKYYRMVYFEPSCKCYPRCPSCGRKLHFEVELDQKGCSHCLWQKCNEEKDVSEFNEKARKNVTKRITCGGIMLPTRGGFRCEKCNTVRAE
jgi:hypothetical protein